MSILVTGGTGMVGKYLKDILPDALYLGSSDCDLRDVNSVNRLWKDVSPKAVIHLASKVGGIVENISSPAEFYDDNILINTNVLMASKNIGVSQLTAILSTCMYPDVVDNYPMTESDIHLGPPSYANYSYAYSKRALSVQIDAYNKQYGTSYNYLIPCNLYGKYDHFNNPEKCHFVTALIKKIIDAENAGDDHITLYGTGKPLRQFMCAEDLARVIKIVVDDRITESFNVATPEEYSIQEMAQIAIRALKQDINILYDQDKPDGQFRKTVSGKRMIDTIGDFDFTPFEDGLVSVYNRAKEIL